MANPKPATSKKRPLIYRAWFIVLCSLVGFVLTPLILGFLYLTGNLDRQNSLSYQAQVERATKAFDRVSLPSGYQVTRTDSYGTAQVITTVATVEYYLSVPAGKTRASVAEDFSRANGRAVVSVDNFDFITANSDVAFNVLYTPSADSDQNGPNTPVTSMKISSR